MKKISASLIGILLIAGLFMSGWFLAFKVGAVDNFPFLSFDPDIPPITQAKNKISKEEYKTRRAEFIAQKRGIHKDQPLPDPQLRQIAVGEMEKQQAEIAARPASPKRDALLAAWTAIGPAPIPNGQTQTISTAVSGRTIAIDVHPSNPNIVYVGTAQGGLYRTIDGGTNWTPLLDNALSLAIGAVAIAPSQPDTVYVGTGEANFSSDSFFGVGVYRIDNASSASPVVTGPLNKNAANADIFTGRAIGEIMVHPTDPATIFVASGSGVGGIGPAAPSIVPNRGIYRSTNATAANPTFTQLTYPFANQNLSARDIVIDPLNPNLLVANVVANGGGLIVSTNALAATPTFTQTQTFSNTSTSELTAELAIHHTNAALPPTIYAATGNLGGRILRSIDSGATWTQQVDNDFCTPQCFYDIAIDVDPTDATRVYIGGAPTTGATRAFQFSITGGTAFVISDTGVHGDSHEIAVAPSLTSTLYLGTDGGIYKSINSGLTWTPLNNTQFSATQFMGLGIHPTNPNITYGGTQDNGTNLRLADGTWTRTDFGDGGFTAVDQSNTSTTNPTAYHTYFNQTNNVIGYAWNNDQLNPFENWVFRSTGLTISDAVLFYAPLETGPGTPNTIYYGTSRLYRSADKGASHTAVSQIINATVPISAIGISPQNDNVRIVGQSNGNIYGTSSGAVILTDLDPSNIVPAVYVSRAVIDPNTATTAYVALSAFGVTNVWKTTNVNAVAPTWTAAAGSGATALPQIPVSAFLVDPRNSNNLYAGTDIGVYSSLDGGATWSPFGTGLPRVAVFDMGFVNGASPSRLLRIATHGRGMYEIAATDVTAAAISISGRVFASNGAPLRSARVVLTDPSNGNARIAVTNAFGYFSFTDVSSGATYAVSVQSKRYSFAPQIVNATAELQDLVFTAN